MKTYIISLFAIVAFACIATANKHETWTSSVGSTIEGVFIGSADSKHWIASSAGRLFKLSDAQLSQESIKRIETHNEKRRERESMQHIKHTDLMPSEATSENEKLVIALCSSKIPNVNFVDTSISSALASLNEMVDSNLAFQLEGDIQDRVLNIQLRNLHANQILDFMTQQLGLYCRIEGGQIVSRDQHQ